jgi:steroid delta-isomerase-like uncharacterized protein
MTTRQIDSAAHVAGFLREVWNEGSLEAVRKYVAARYTIHHDPGDPWNGKVLDHKGFEERVRLSRAPFPDQRFTLQESFVTTDAVVITWLWTGTHLADLPGFPASGKSISSSGITIYYVANGLITGHWQITDRLGVFQQLRRP